MDPVKVENHNTFLDDDATIDTDAAEAAIRAQFSRKRTKTGKPLPISHETPFVFLLRHELLTYH